MMTKKEIRLLRKVQKATLTFYTKGQLPKCLVSRIQKLNEKSSSVLVSFLSDSCERYLRVVGYYRKHPEEESVIGAELCLRMKEKGII